MAGQRSGAERLRATDELLKVILSTGVGVDVDR